MKRSRSRMAARSTASCRIAAMVPERPRFRRRSKSSKTSRPRSDRSRASARPRSFRYGDLAPGCTTRAILAPLNGDPVPAAALGVVEGFVGESIELLEIARRPHLGDPDARGDQPLAHRLAMIARRDPAADAFGEAAEADALHPDRQQAELFPPPPRDRTHPAFPPP